MLRGMENQLDDDGEEMEISEDGEEERKEMEMDDVLGLVLDQGEEDDEDGEDDGELWIVDSEGRQTVAFGGGSGNGNEGENGNANEKEEEVKMEEVGGTIAVKVEEEADTRVKVEEEADDEREEGEIVGEEDEKQRYDEIMGDSIVHGQDRERRLTFGHSDSINTPPRKRRRETFANSDFSQQYQPYQQQHRPDLIETAGLGDLSPVFSFISSERNREHHGRRSQSPVPPLAFSPPPTMSQLGGQSPREFAPPRVIPMPSYSRSDEDIGGIASTSQLSQTRTTRSGTFRIPTLSTAPVLPSHPPAVPSSLRRSFSPATVDISSPSVHPRASSSVPKSLFGVGTTVLDPAVLGERSTTPVDLKGLVPTSISVEEAKRLLESRPLERGTYERKRNAEIAKQDAGNGAAG